MAAETGVPLPVLAKTEVDERLSSWLTRTAAIYLVSPDALVAHIGLRTKRIHDLDLDPHADDIARLVAATGVSVARLSQMTFRDAPETLRGFIDVESREICPACVGEARPRAAPRLREWTHPFAFWCAKHGGRLKSADIDGVGVLSDEASARRGARYWRALAMGADETTPTTAAVMNLLLAPCRSPSPAAPWELAGASSWIRAELQKEPVRTYPRLALSCVVPEYDRAVAVCDRRLPREFQALASARAVERRAVAIGLGRTIAFPVEAAVCILQRCDDFGRRRIEDELAAWPAHLRAAIDRARRRVRSGGASTPWRRAVVDRAPRPTPRSGCNDEFDDVARLLVAEHEASLRHLPVEERLDRLQALAQAELEGLRLRVDRGRRGPAGAHDREDV
ncbi:TniQ family protein [Methylosinus sp. LW3]|uniref:TniQ family protein n=1 Tax=Methylosinus sp. LW3 TaxID=107635 RepID=UPI0004653D09|nr:TniQ family protein [Methylosinus sp. LW3]